MEGFENCCFTLPVDCDSWDSCYSNFKKLSTDVSKVLVISFIGKSRFGSYGCKGSVVDGLLQREVFKHAFPSDNNEALLEDKIHIEGYYVKQKRCIFLHLKGGFDTYEFAQIYETLKNQHFMKNWTDIQQSYLKALLFIFSISHIVFVTNPTATFDADYIPMFQILDLFRTSMTEHIGNILQTIPGICSEWIENARVCSPRVLFLFEREPRGLKFEKDPEIYANEGSHGVRNNPIIKKFEETLEDQIYILLRKSRIVTNISANSLFAIPTNTEYVFVCFLENGQQPITSMEFLMNKVYEICQEPSSRVGTLKDPVDKIREGYISSLWDLPHCSMSLPKWNRFELFLQLHINQAFSKGFDDNFGRHSVPTMFHLPPCNIWFQATTKLYKCLLGKSAHTDVNEIFEDFRLSLDADVQFSENRCSKVLPLAMASYQENLPTHYDKEYHERKLNRALALLRFQARGPCCNDAIEKLTADCGLVWRSGHQMCSAISLSGNPCKLPKHITEEDDLPVVDEDGASGTSLQVKSHSSGVRYISTCNCGRKQSHRDDPFTVQSANCEFYQSLTKLCCHGLESIPFPVFQPSIAHYRAAEVTHRNVESYQDETEVITELQSATCDFVPSLTAAGSGSDDTIVVLSEAIKEVETAEKCLVRQPSTTEYLPGMLHSFSPEGLLPQFSSWSLVCLGSASIYSHQSGLSHDAFPGFLPGTNFLLPWDVVLKKEGTEQAIDFSKGAYPKGKRNKANDSTVNPENMVKVFIGVEYECPRGHRFMSAGPDRIIKVSSLGGKENAMRLIYNDMPLYMSCICRPINSKALVGQLMRLHVVTPKSSTVNITLNARVKPWVEPSEQAPIFVTGHDDPIKLIQGSYWILRLPYSYVGDNGPYYPPKDPSTIPASFLLQGAFGISRKTETKGERKGQ